MLQAAYCLPADCDERSLEGDERCSSVALVGLPERWPSLTGRPADEDIRVILALFVLHAEGIADVSGHLTACEVAIYFLP